jgi:beta-lactamase class D
MLAISLCVLYNIKVALRAATLNDMAEASQKFFINSFFKLRKSY